MHGWGSRREIGDDVTKGGTRGQGSSGGSRPGGCGAGRVGGRSDETGANRDRDPALVTRQKPAWLINATRRLEILAGASLPGKLVILESPYAGDRRRNAAYLRACLRDSLFERGEFPYASHRMYTGVTDDDVPDERALGIRAGLEWGRKADATIVYADLGITRGMALGIADANEQGRPVFLRYLRGRWGRP